jgi:hypothetical protein
MPVAVKAPGTPVLDDLEARLIVAIKQLICNTAGRRLVSQLQSLRAEPLHTYNRDEAVRKNAADCGCGLEIFEAGHFLRVLAFCTFILALWSLALLVHHITPRQ